MKTSLLIFLFVVVSPLFLNAQITTPVIRANFGVDADLRSSYFNGLVQAGNDDWFRLPGSDTLGKFVIDTTGAAGILVGYLSDASPWPKRMASFYRTMKYPTFSVVNNRLLMDALFVRDYHGTDTTTFAAGSNKNGMSPVDWTGVVQNIPDKNDILDMFVHIRRAGPNKTDSLWMLGALSLDNTTGNRYFDFEMYQTDIYYDRVTQKFYGYGPDAGHTSWQIDPTSGYVNAPGDIIFTASYQSSTLTNIEARIWINQSALSITPAQFSWSGQFDGASAGATFGYASILPKVGSTFYTGLGSVNNTWTGPFQLVLQDNSLATNYVKDQFMEFSVNMTKLGLDPVAGISGDICGTPFRRILVKTRASASFTAELKDFVAPTDLFLAPRVQASPNIPIFCSDTAISDISVINPSPTSLYVWSTPDGHIITNPPEGTTIRVDMPGTYIVTQYLQSGCSAYAADTVTIIRDTNCVVLENSLLYFRGRVNKNIARLKWSVTNNRAIRYFNLERSTDGVHFAVINRIENRLPENREADYSSTDLLNNLQSANVYYRLNLTGVNGNTGYSKVIRLPLFDIGSSGFIIMPNPVRNQTQLNISSATNSDIQVYIYNMVGKKVRTMNAFVQQGSNIITLDDLSGWQRGVYQIVVKLGNNIFFGKMILIK